MSKEAEEFYRKFKREFKQKNSPEFWDERRRFDAMQAYADEKVRPVQQELERWKYLYQTEFDKNKLKTK